MRLIAVISIISIPVPLFFRAVAITELELSKPEKNTETTRY